METKQLAELISLARDEGLTSLSITRDGVTYAFDLAPPAPSSLHKELSEHDRHQAEKAAERRARAELFEASDFEPVED